MILSMTGYGKGTHQSENFTVIAEIKSLNGKTTDVRCRLPQSYKEQEITLRKLILENAFRGKMDYSITIQSDQPSDDYTIAPNLFKHYYKDITKLEAELGIQSSSDYVQTILRIPGVVDTQYVEVSEEEYNTVVEATKMAIKELNEFRKTEGVSLKKDLTQRIKNIENLLSEVPKHEEARITALKERIKRNLEDIIPQQQIDKNRFEQEILFYLEKLDINEEKVRLAQHLIYFMEILDSDKLEVGKKLGFISQEIGREINTLGAKAQDKNLQQIVVSMKDELEKIKEQLFNVV